jgi:uncharacterized RDD family membrane protein YckC
MEWHYLKEGRVLGPVPGTSIRAWLDSGFLNTEDLVWQSGMSEWTPLSEVPEFGGEAPAGTTGGGISGAGEFAGGLIGRAAAPEGCSGFAGFWLRAGAYAIDGIILSGTLFLFWSQVKPDLVQTLLNSYQTLAQSVDWPTYWARSQEMMVTIQKAKSDPYFTVGFYVLPWLYYALMESSPWQATLGKRAFQLKVTDLDGRRLNFIRASLRHFAKLISEFAFMLGFVLAGFTPRRQALHDLLSRCLVLRR